MSRRTRTLHPTTEVCLQPKIITGVPETIRHQKQKAKQQYDKTAKPLPQLQIGQPIRLQPNNHNMVSDRGHLPWYEVGWKPLQPLKTQSKDQSLKEMP